ncbi:MAG: 3'-5' exonuclease [Cyclobacteriaceae bacterium]|nr:3'-5' exonuclease [Cyclobacteriaceae bacterium]
MNSGLRDILFLDIETVAATDDFNSLDERLKVQWSRKASFLKREEGVTDEQLFHQRAGIYAEFGKIICIAVGKLFEGEVGETKLKTKAFYGHDEKAVLTEFSAMLDKMDSSTVKFCAHNGKEFDFPYLSRRMLVNGIPLPQPLNLSGRKSWEIPHLDTMELWKFGDYKHYTSLDLLAAIFKIPSSKNGIDGSQVNSVYYKEKNLERIKDYCVSDVVVLTQLFLRIRGLPLVPDKNIITSS